MEEKLVAIGEGDVDYYRLLRETQDSVSEADAEHPGILGGEVREDEGVF